MPAGALFYMEARNFSKIVSDWDASPEKKTWLESASYQSYLRSHLLTRLTEARKSYAEAAGVPEDAPLLQGIAGDESALAFVKGAEAFVAFGLGHGLLRDGCLGIG